MGTVAAVVLTMLAVAPLAHAEEQTRETYKAQVEPLCQVNRTANERIMQGAQKRINKKEFALAGKQFVRVSESFGGLVKQLAGVPAPPAEYYKEGEDIKAAHESVLAERAGITANNTSIVFHFHYCRFGRFARG